MDKEEQQAPPYLFPENQFALQLRIIWANLLEEYKPIIFLALWKEVVSLDIMQNERAYLRIYR